jgi:RNA polymerase sigma-70 factor (ECF subfamily)
LFWDDVEVIRSGNGPAAGKARWKNVKGLQFAGCALGWGQVNTTKVETENFSSSPAEKTSHQPAFVTTHWSVVLTANQCDTTRAREALGRLCQTYWYPLYAYVRRRGHSAPDAQDLTQAFFARLLEKNWIGSADPEKGRFRAFLLIAMKRFLADEWDRVRAQKRGGGQPLLTLQFDSAETRLSHEPADEITPEQSFERRWVLTLLDEVLNRLRTEYDREGNGELFAELHPCLVGDRAALPYAELAGKLSLSENAVKSAVHRLRQHYRRLLRDEIARTVAAPGEVDEELRHLFVVLGRNG